MFLSFCCFFFFSFMDRFGFLWMCLKPNERKMFHNENLHRYVRCDKTYFKLKIISNFELLKTQKLNWNSTFVFSSCLTWMLLFKNQRTVSWSSPSFVLQFFFYGLFFNVLFVQSTWIYPSAKDYTATTIIIINALSYRNIVYLHAHILICFFYLFFYYYFPLSSFKKKKK